MRWSFLGLCSHRQDLTSTGVISRALKPSSQWRSAIPKQSSAPGRLFRKPLFIGSPTASASLPRPVPERVNALQRRNRREPVAPAVAVCRWTEFELLSACSSLALVWL